MSEQQQTSPNNRQLPQQQLQQQRPRRLRPRRVFTVMGRRFEVLSPRLIDGLMTIANVAAESLIYVLGPILIVFASAIISGLAYSFFWIVLPMMQRHYEHHPFRNVVLSAHVLFVVFLLVNVVFNYVLCVVTSNTGHQHDKVVRELASAMGMLYPESQEELQRYRRDFQDRMALRLQIRQQRATAAAAAAVATEQAAAVAAAAAAPLSSAAAAAASTDANHVVVDVETQQQPPPQQPQPQPLQPPVQRSWMLMGPLEWGFCHHSNQPKPPRAHFDHVSKTLVLCLDHYCPWMFNTIGYFNYRYFFNFLLFVAVSMIYGAMLTYRPFRNLAKHEYWKQIEQAQQLLQQQQFQQQRQLVHSPSSSHIMHHHHPSLVVSHIYDMVPIPSEKLPITLSFMLCISVGVAVLCLAFFHLYLILTAQTTIEFHANYSNRRRARAVGRTFSNPYDMGYKRNWQQVYGATRHPLAALLVPSTRQPEFLPVPLEGENGKRQLPLSQQPRDRRRKQAAASSPSSSSSLPRFSHATTTSTDPSQGIVLSSWSSSVRRRNDASITLV